MPRNDKKSDFVTPLSISVINGLNRGGVGKIGDFQPISRRISETLREGYYWSLIGSRIRPFRWHENHRPRMTLKGQ